MVVENTQIQRQQVAAQLGVALVAQGQPLAAVVVAAVGKVVDLLLLVALRGLVRRGQRFL